MGKIARAEADSTAIVETEFKEKVQELSLSKLLELAEAPERMLEVDFDPSTLIGSLSVEVTEDQEKASQLRDALKEKVDNSYRMIEALEAFASHQEMRAERYLDRARSAKKRAKAIENYFAFNMKQSEISELRGVDYKVFEKFSSNPTAVYYREPEAEDHIRFPEFVREIPASYEWIANPIKETLKPFHREIKDQPACSDCKGKGTTVDSDDFIVDCMSCVGTGKKIPEHVDVPVAHAFAGLQYSSKFIFDDNYQAPPTRKKKK